MKNARVEQGWSQNDLAIEIGVSQAVISRWETGKQEPEERERKLLLRTLGDFDHPKRNRRRRENEEADESEDNEPEDNLEDDESVEEDLDADYEDDDEEDDEANAFGDWLQEARARAGMSRKALAEAAEVSRTVIHNIESGRTQNPQIKTRKRLEHALRQTVPDDVSDETVEEQRIEGLGTLINFDPYKTEDLPEHAGIYVFYDVSDRPIYVGESSNIARRVREHSDKFWFKYPIVSHAAYVEVHDKVLRRQVEQVMIKFLKSNAVINKQSVER